MPATDPLAVLQAAGLPAQGPARRLAGGDTSAVHRVGAYVVKTMPGGGTHALASEARSLRLLAEHDLPVPAVLTHTPGALVLPYLPPGRPRPTAIGQLVARLHAVRGHQYGAQAPVAIASIALPSGHSRRWSEVFADHRVLPLLGRCDGLDPTMARRIERLVTTFDHAEEGPCLVHGDLWSGNVHHAETGPVFIDPSACWGERVLDLAMMALFGGFDGTIDTTWRRERPVPREVEEAIPLHQLYFLLVHAALFGPQWLGRVRDVLDHYGA